VCVCVCVCVCVSVRERERERERDEPESADDGEGKWRTEDKYSCFKAFKNKRNLPPVLPSPGYYSNVKQ